MSRKRLTPRYFDFLMDLNLVFLYCFSSVSHTILTQNVNAICWHQQMIVVGARGFGAVASAILGSLTSHLVAHSPIDVLVVKSSGEK